MELMIQDHVDRTLGLLRGISSTPRGRALLVYHGDCDGCASAALFGLSLRKLCPAWHIEYRSVRTEQFDFQSALTEIEHIKPELLVFLDLSIQDYPEKLGQAAAAASRATIVYDHHSIRSEPPAADLLYLNPSLAPSGEYIHPSPPPCFFAYDLLRRISGIDAFYVAALGIYSDRLADHFPEIFAQVSRSAPEILPAKPGMSPSEYIAESRFQECAHAIQAAFWGPPDVHEQQALAVLQDLASGKSPGSFFDDSNRGAKALRDNSRSVSLEIERTALLVLSNASRMRPYPLRYAEIHSPFRIGGAVAGRVARETPHDVVVVGQRYNDRFVVEARRGKHVSADVSVLLRTATTALSPINVGGHPFAAGAALVTDGRLKFVRALATAADDLLPRSFPEPSFGWGATKIQEGLSPLIRQVSYGFIYLLRRQNRDGSWARPGDVRRMVATHQAVMSLLGLGFAASSGPVAKGLDWLSSSKRDHHHRYWRIGALAGIAQYKELVRQDFHLIEEDIRQGASPHSRHVMELFMIQAPSLLPGYLDQKRHDSYLTSILAKRSVETGWNDHPSPTAHAASLVERFPVAGRSDILCDSWLFLRRKVHIDGDLAHWDSSIVATSYVLINTAESDDAWNDVHLVEILRKAARWVASRQRGDGSWAQEDPIYGGGRDVVSDEYTTAVAIRALAAHASRTVANFTYQLGSVHVALARERLYRGVKRLAVAGIVIILGGIAYWVVPKDQTILKIVVPALTFAATAVQGIVAWYQLRDRVRQ
jgi:hypothetical protein